MDFSCVLAVWVAICIFPDFDLSLFVHSCRSAHILLAIHVAVDVIFISQHFKNAFPILCFPSQGCSFWSPSPSTQPEFQRTRSTNLKTPTRNTTTATPSYWPGSPFALALSLGFCTLCSEKNERHDEIQNWGGGLEMWGLGEGCEVSLLWELFAKSNESYTVHLIWARQRNKYTQGRKVAQSLFMSWILGARRCLKNFQSSQLLSLLL